MTDREDVLSFPDDLLIELVEHARKIRRNTGVVALVAVSWVAYRTLRSTIGFDPSLSDVRPIRR